MRDILIEIKNAIIDGHNALVKEKVEVALNQGLNPADILNIGMVEAMAEVGRRFERGESFVPEMLLAARAMQSGLVILRASLVKADFKATGKVAIGTVKGDLHDIGKNLVSMMLEGAGFEIIDLGTDVAPEKFASVARESGANLVGMSALLTTTMKNMKSVIEALEDVGERQKGKVMIGGGPVTEAFAKEIGADGYAPDASRAVALAKSFG